jgi:hypothetical protein
MLARTTPFIVAALVTLGASSSSRKGPFSPDAWPPTMDSSKIVHFIDLDGKLLPPSPRWSGNLKILTGGDHATEKTQAGGRDCVRIAMFKFNTADDQYPVWAKEHSIDILLQVWGDSALLDKDGNPRDFNFLTGTLPEPIAVDGGVIPPEANNGRWNWVLCRISNGLRHMDGGRLIGTIHPKAKADPGIAGVSVNSGQNGGTIRLDGLPGVKVRVVAFGQHGAFGEPDQVNHFSR